MVDWALIRIGPTVGVVLEDGFQRSCHDAHTPHAIALLLSSCLRGACKLIFAGDVRREKRFRLIFPRFVSLFWDRSVDSLPLTLFLLLSSVSI